MAVALKILFSCLLKCYGVATFFLVFSSKFSLGFFMALMLDSKLILLLILLIRKLLGFFVIVVRTTIGYTYTLSISITNFSYTIAFIVDSELMELMESY